MLNKEICEICGFDVKATLHIHHIIEQHEIGTNNSDENCVVLCANCHNDHHHGTINVLAVLKSTNGRVVIYEKDGIKNIDINLPRYHKTEKGLRIRK